MRMQLRICCFGFLLMAASSQTALPGASASVHAMLSARQSACASAVGRCVTLAETAEEIGRKLLRDLEASRNQAEKLSRPLQGSAPPSVLAPTPQDQAERSKERAIQRFDNERKLDIDQKIQDAIGR